MLSSLKISTATGETTDRGMFDFFNKNEDKPNDDAAMIELETTQESELEEKHTQMEELNRTPSNSSSSSDEDEGRKREKKKKKGLKEKIKDNISGTDNEEKAAENCNAVENPEAPEPEEKKGFLEKIKEKLPGLHEKPEDCTAKPPPECEADAHSPAGETKEKKGIMEKIKDKLPGSHKNGEEEK